MEVEYAVKIIYKKVGQAGKKAGKEKVNRSKKKFSPCFEQRFGRVILKKTCIKRFWQKLSVIPVLYYLFIFHLAFRLAFCWLI